MYILINQFSCASVNELTIASDYTPYINNMQQQNLKSQICFRLIIIYILYNSNNVYHVFVIGLKHD